MSIYGLKSAVSSGSIGSGSSGDRELLLDTQRQAYLDIFSFHQGLR